MNGKQFAALLRTVRSEAAMVCYYGVPRVVATAPAINYDALHVTDAARVSNYRALRGVDTRAQVTTTGRIC